MYIRNQEWELQDRQIRSSKDTTLKERLTYLFKIDTMNFEISID